MSDPEKVKKIVKEGYLIADKIKNASSVSEIDALAKRIEEYCDFVNENFGIVDEFAEDKNEKYSDLTFYVHMAINEKKDHLNYYNLHSDETSSGILDFIDYLESKKWVK